MTKEIQTVIALNLALLLQLGGLVSAIWVDKHIQKRQKRLLLIISAIVFSLIIQNQVQDIFVRENQLIGLHTSVIAYGYAVRPAVIILFIQILTDDKKIRYLWALAAVNAVIYFSSYRTKWGFYISPRHIFVRGPLNFFCFALGFALLAINAAVIISQYRRKKNSDLAIPLFGMLIIAASVIADIFTEKIYISLLTVSMVSGVLFAYIWLHLRFVLEHERVREEEAHIKLMMSQIEPHFLYNVLANIKALCGKDPEKAAEMTGEFAAYLRQNLEALDGSGLIPFERELEHTKLFIDIEKMRLSNIEAEYDITYSDFCLPAFTVQPIVENAIKHGLFKAEKGIVKISTKNENGFNGIIISDNGVGFDASLINEFDNKHIGVRNVRERIQKMCGGTLEINSRIGEGTSVVIKIPEEADK